MGVVNDFIFGYVTEPTWHDMRKTGSCGLWASPFWPLKSEHQSHTDSYCAVIIHVQDCSRLFRLESNMLSQADIVKKGPLKYKASKIKGTSGANIQGVSLPCALSFSLLLTNIIRYDCMYKHHTQVANIAHGMWIEEVSMKLWSWV